MSFKLLGTRFKARPAQEQSAPAQPAQSGGDPAQAEASKRQLAEAQAIVERSKRELEEAKRQAALANQERDSTVLTTTLTSGAAKRRAVNPDHAVALLKDRFAVQEGKVVVKADPAKPVDGVLDEFFSKEAPYLVAPATPRGAGAGNFPGAPPGAPPRDLRTDAGATGYVREKFGSVLSPGKEPQGSGQ